MVEEHRLFHAINKAAMAVHSDRIEWQGLKITHIKTMNWRTKTGVHKRREDERCSMFGVVDGGGVAC